MSKGHYLDCIDDAFFYLTLSKQRCFVLFMVQQHKTATKKLGECILLVSSSRLAK
jgi:hypothetical protein